MNIINFDRGITVAHIFRGELTAPDWCTERFFEALEAGAAAAATEVFHLWCCHPEWGDDLLTVSISKTEKDLPEGFRSELWERGVVLRCLYEVEWLTTTCVLQSKKVSAISEEEAIRTLLREEHDVNPEASAWPRVVAA